MVPSNGVRIVSHKRLLVVTHSSRDRDSVLWQEVLSRDPRFDLVMPEPASLSQAEWSRPWIQENRVLPLKTVRISKSSQTSFVYPGLKKLIAQRQYRFAHVATEPWNAISQTLISHTPVVVHGAETIIREAPIPYRIRRLGTRRVLRSAVGVAAWGKESLHEFIRCGVPPQTPTAVIPMGIPNPQTFSFSPLREPDGPTRILFVGRLVEEKGVQDLVAALRLGPDLPVELRIGGVGPLQQRVEASLQNDRRIQLLGDLHESQVVDQLRWCDVCVVPSRVTRTWTEQWGRVGAESLFAGRPIISSDSGELRHLNPNPDLTYPAGDPSALGEVLRVFTSVGKDQRLLWGERARTHSLLYAPRRTGLALMRFWDNVFSQLD